MEHLLTVKEAARYLHLKEVTIYRLAQRSKIPAVKVGGSWRFKKELLDEWIRRRARGSFRQILIVDDDPAIRAILTPILTAKGYQVSEASDGERAIEAVKKQRFDLILLDVILPGSSGLEVFKAIREQDSRALVVLITGYPDHAQVAEALALGPVMLMRKPFGVKELEDVLQMVFKE